MTLKTTLKRLRACEEAVAWVGNQSLAEAWASCERGDWMLWLTGKMAGKTGWPTRQEVVLAACDCAKLALPYVTKGETRPRVAIDTARKWARGKATLKDVRSAAAAAFAAAYAAAADAAAYAAAYAAAAVAAAAAFDVAAYAVGGCAAAADASTRRNTLKKCAALIRERLTIPETL